MQEKRLIIKMLIKNFAEKIKLRCKKDKWSAISGISLVILSLSFLMFLGINATQFVLHNGDKCVYSEKEFMQDIKSTEEYKLYVGYIKQQFIDGKITSIEYNKAVEDAEKIVSYLKELNPEEIGKDVSDSLNNYLTEQQKNEDLEKDKGKKIKLEVSCEAMLLLIGGISSTVSDIKKKRDIINTEIKMWKSIKSVYAKNPTQRVIVSLKDLDKMIIKVNGQAISYSYLYKDFYNGDWELYKCRLRNALRAMGTANEFGDVIEINRDRFWAKIDQASCKELQKQY